MESTKKIVVIDGMGGAIGKSLVEKIRDEVQNVHIICAGTNSVALKRMLDAGGSEGTVDQTQMIHHLEQADIIVGAMGILIPNGLAGEMSQDIVISICKSKAIKILIPMDKCGIRIATKKETISYYIDCAISQIKEL